jgi:hypothetical protein
MATKLPGFAMSAYQSAIYFANIITSEDQYKYLMDRHMAGNARANMELEEI